MREEGHTALSTRSSQVYRTPDDLQRSPSPNDQNRAQTQMEDEAHDEQGVDVVAGVDDEVRTQNSQ